VLIANFLSTNKGLAEPVPNLGTLASKLTDLGKEIAEQEKGKPVYN
jgi:hypothetical protein